jgi:prepilin-type N-terminal cleavage/methylation domain-containing protein
MELRHDRTLPMTRGPPGACARAADRGFTLVEVLVGAVIAGIALSAVSWTMVSAAEAKAVLSEDPMPYLLAREIRELAGVLPRDPSGTVGVTRGSDVAALDSLHGAVFSPPLRADKTADAALSGWAQRVTLAVCALDAARTPTGESPTLGVGRTARRLYRLTVAVTHAGQEVDRFEWFLTP